MEEVKKEIIRHMNEHSFVKEWIRRNRYFQEKCFAANINHGLILNGEDFNVIEKFCKDHNIHEGMGFSVFMGYIINYYKLNNKEIIKSLQKDLEKLKEYKFK